MKNYIIQKKVNPTDKWQNFKQFDTFNQAMQSLIMLKKHNFNILKNSDYNKYRLFDKLNNKYYEK